MTKNFSSASRVLSAMGERGEDGWLPVISVESHELASPGKRLLWHLEHFRAPIDQCQFAGAPIHALETRPEVKRLVATGWSVGAAVDVR